MRPVPPTGRRPCRGRGPRRGGGSAGATGRRGARPGCAAGVAGTGAAAGPPPSSRGQWDALGHGDAHPVGPVAGHGGPGHPGQALEPGGAAPGSTSTSGVRRVTPGRLLDLGRRRWVEPVTATTRASNGAASEAARRPPPTPPPPGWPAPSAGAAQPAAASARRRGCAGRRRPGVRGSAGRAAASAGPAGGGGPAGGWSGRRHDDPRHRAPGPASGSGRIATVGDGEADQADLGAQVDPAALGHHPPHMRRSAATSSAEPPSSAWMKLACFSDTRAVPRRTPFSPAASTRRPAESPGGLVNTEPALLPPGWCWRRQRTISASGRPDRPRRSPGQSELGPHHHLAAVSDEVR